MLVFLLRTDVGVVVPANLRDRATYPASYQYHHWMFLAGTSILIRYYCPQGWVASSVTVVGRDGMVPRRLLRPGGPVEV